MTKLNIILAQTGKQNQNMMGTLDLLNAGFVNVPLSEIVPGQLLTPPIAIAVLFEVDFALAGRPLDLELELLDDDGKPVDVPSPEGPQPMVMRQTVRARAMLARAGSPARGNVLVMLPTGLPLFPDSMYKWKAKLAGEEREDWEASFYVLPLDSRPTFGAEVRPAPPGQDGG